LPPLPHPPTPVHTGRTTVHPTTPPPQDTSCDTSAGALWHGIGTEHRPSPVSYTWTRGLYTKNRRPLKRTPARRRLTRTHGGFPALMVASGRPYIVHSAPRCFAWGRKGQKTPRCRAIWRTLSSTSSRVHRDTGGVARPPGGVPHNHSLYSRDRNYMVRIGASCAPSWGRAMSFAAAGVPGASELGGQDQLVLDLNGRTLHLGVHAAHWPTDLRLGRDARMPTGSR